MKFSFLKFLKWTFSSRAKLVPFLFLFFLNFLFKIYAYQDLAGAPCDPFLCGFWRYFDYMPSLGWWMAEVLLLVALVGLWSSYLILFNDNEHREKNGSN